MAVIWVTTVNNESSCGEAAGSAVPGGGGARLAPVRPRGGAARWGPGAGSEVAAAVAASGTSARGALALPPLARRPPPAGPPSPRPAGPGRRRRGHVALGPAAAGTYFLQLVLPPPGRPRAASRAPVAGKEPRGRGAGDRLGLSGGGRGGRSRRSPARPRRASRPRARDAQAGRRRRPLPAPRFSVPRASSQVFGGRSRSVVPPEQTGRGNGKEKRLTFPVSSNLGHV